MELSLTILASSIWLLAIEYYRNSRDLSGVLQESLNNQEFKITGIKYPGFFTVGPFPKFSFKVGGIQSSVPFFGRGEYSIYKIVEVEYRGNKYKSWALVEYELFQIKTIEWKNLPEV